MSGTKNNNKKKQKNQRQQLRNNVKNNMHPKTRLFCNLRSIFTCCYSRKDVMNKNKNMNGNREET